VTIEILPNYQLSELEDIHTTYHAYPTPEAIPPSFYTET
jgi:hypothetical protein